MSWLKCREWLLAALCPDDWSEPELLERLACNKAQLWPGERSAMVTECIIEPERTVVHCWLAGGDLQEILMLIPGIEAWARAQGCTHATLDGRKGWARLLKPIGYLPGQDELVKVL